MAKSTEKFEQAMEGKKIPILTLDNRWHQIFTQSYKDEKIRQLSEELNDLLGKQGGLNQNIKEIKKLKTKLMDEIVNGMDGKTMSENEMEEHKKLINDCNVKIEEYKDQLLEYPKEIDSLNRELMLRSMELCYDTFSKNTEEMIEISKWISQIRLELKQNVIKKQEKEMMNQGLYTYMREIFGPEVISVFDMKYDPGKSMLKKSSEKES